MVVVFHLPPNRLTATVAAVIALAVVHCAGDEAVEPTALPLTSADVSFLLPLQQPMPFGAATATEFGVLIPREVFDAIPPLTRVDEPDAIYDALQVVGVRLDPCFFEGAGEVVCSPQVRLVLQPVFVSAGGSLTTRDATLHAFYAVPVDELVDLSQELVRARLDAGGDEVLGVTSIAAAAIDAVSAHVGEGRLLRVTFVSVHASEEAWSFGGFDRVDGTLVPIAIPGVVEPEQHLSSLGGSNTLDSTILPAPVIEPTIDAFLRSDARVDLQPDEIDQAMGALERLLDAAAHNPGTVNCASCHIATPAMRYATASTEPNRVDSVYDNTRNQRMFGWFGQTPSISPRVHSETSAVLNAFLQLP